MRNIIFAINVTIDGFADHTAVIADDELHDFFTNLLKNSDTILFGRITYQLMENYWPNVYDEPNAAKSEIDFADAINGLSKVVFSTTLENVQWGKYNNATLIKEDIAEAVLKIKEQPGKNISVGSISIASALMKQNMIDEYWFLIHPVICGSGKKLFDGVGIRSQLHLINTRTLKSGVVVLHYKKN